MSDSKPEIVMKAETMAAACAHVMLASVNEEGYPSVCVLSKNKAEGIRKIFVSTGLSSAKVRNFRSNPRASVCFYENDDSVTLVGRVRIEQERAIREEMWIDWFTDHFPAGIDDTNYCVLVFHTEEATLWIDGEFATLSGDQL